MVIESSSERQLLMGNNSLFHHSLIHSHTDSFIQGWAFPSASFSALEERTVRETDTLTIITACHNQCHDSNKHGVRAHGVLAWRIPWTEKPGRLQSMGHNESYMTEQLYCTHRTQSRNDKLRLEKQRRLRERITQDQWRCSNPPAIPEPSKCVQV